MTMEFTLAQTGRPPLVLRGECLAQESSELIAGSTEATRWHEAAVYRTESGRYVLAIGYRTRWQGELGRDLVEVLNDVPAQVAQRLAAYDPAAHALGYPPGEAYAERQARMVADLTARYEAMVSRMLAGRPEFAERLE